LLRRNVIWTANSEIIKEKQIEMLVIHFSSAPYWVGCAMSERPIKQRIQRTIQKHDWTNGYGAVDFAWMEHCMNRLSSQAVAQFTSPNLEI
jgi:hypothetical protein